VRQNALNASTACEQLERLKRSSPALQRWWLAFILSVWTGGGFANGSGAAVVDAESQERVAQLLQTVQDYWKNGDARSAAGINGGWNFTNVESAFREASKLMPDRLDLRFAVASSLMIQAIQTNGLQLETKVKDALRVYQEIHALDTNGFEAPILYAAYTRAIGETNASQAAISGLMATHPARTREYLEKFRLVDRLLQTTPNEKPPSTMPQDKHHAIIILGAGLEANGAMKAKLASRLEQGLKLARIYPNAPIILTGGNQKSGVTETYVMSQWCVQRGIPRKRLILEDRAKDTVENALFSSAILRRLRVTHVTLVTSASHVRRGLADLQEACLQRGLKLQYDNLAARANGDADLDKEQERLSVYRDVMRTSGLWAFPGIQR
jgi:uncharacterized SAM-binding protein YcdF (DUF218 family)